jgi:transposase-like protein
MTKPRKHYSAVEKVAILRRHLLERVPVSDLCDQCRIQTSVFYNWQKQFFEKGGPLPSSYLARRRKSIKSEESPPFTKAMALFDQIRVHPSRHTTLCGGCRSPY